MQDLTVIMLTVNRVPKIWAEHHKRILLEAIGDTVVITISKVPLNWGNNIIQAEEPSVENIYRQMLIGAKMATTEYIAIAEDDTLYEKEHFTYRPPKDCFAYNINCWSLFTWRQPFFYKRRHIVNSTLIAPRQLAVEALAERFDKYNPLPRRLCGELGTWIEYGYDIIKRKRIEFSTKIPVITFNHVYSIDPLENKRKKRPTKIQATDLPYWGTAVEVRKLFI